MAQLERFNHGGHHDEHTLPVLMRAALPTCSSRGSTRFSMAMAAKAGC
jgi:hypothetical protein